jgi:hypothetical protein
MKTILLSIGMIFPSLNIFAQATVTSTNIEKENRNAVLIQINQPADVTSEALKERLKRSGLEGKSKSGVTAYRGVILAEIAPEKIDMYTKVDKGPDDNSSLVYVAVSKGYDNFANSAEDSVLIERVKTFLNSFVKDANTMSVDNTIRTQMEEVSDNEKEYERLLNEKKDLEKKKADIETSLIEIEKRISEKRAEIDRKKEALEVLKNQRGEIK